MAGKNKKNSKGFTFIEFLIYIGIVSVVVSTFIAFNINIIKGKSKITAIEETTQSAVFSMEKISRSIRDADSIISPVPGNSSSSLSLTMKDSAKNPTEFALVSSDGIWKLAITEGESSPVFLTSDSAEIAELEFLNASYENTPGTIMARMTIEFHNPLEREEFEFERTFYLTENVRK